jgi:hypothetical protein
MVGFIAGYRIGAERNEKGDKLDFTVNGAKTGIALYYEERNKKWYMWVQNQVVWFETFREGVNFGAYRVNELLEKYNRDVLEYFKDVRWVKEPDGEGEALIIGGQKRGSMVWEKRGWRVALWDGKLKKDMVKDSGIRRREEAQGMLFRRVLESKVAALFYGLTDEWVMQNKENIYEMMAGRGGNRA